MEEYSDDILVGLVKKLAAHLHDEEGAGTLALLQKLQFLSRLAMSQPPDAAPAPPVAAPQPLRIGIWEADGQGGFVRATRLATEWRCWADVPSIPKKGRKKRVVLLGESVARGYLYDPFLTPASLLERMLCAAGSDCEVIDLARIDLTPQGLAPLLLALPALSPDAIVLFAGNNWHTPEELGIADFEQAFARLSQGWHTVRQYFVDAYLPWSVKRIFARLAQAVVACGSIPVTVIIPEFNLRDWQSEPTLVSPILPKQNNLPWLDLFDRAERLAQDERYDEVEPLARRLIELDGGTSASSQRLLAKSLLARGARTEARFAFEAARDAPCGLFLGMSPRCPTTIQQAMRENAALHGFELVDLPHLLGEAFDSTIADRRSFLDYCHLTLDGLRAAMSATAERLAPHFGAPSVTRAELATTEIPLSPIHEATAHVLAAIHNAHYGQDDEILLYHCRRALSLSPSVGEDLLGYLDFQCRRAPRWMCRSFVGLARSASVARYLASTMPNADDKFADYALCRAMAHALDERGLPGSVTLASVLATEHGCIERVDLLMPVYSSPHKWLRDGYERDLRPAYLRACGRSTSFFLPRACSQALRLRLTWRIPDDGGVVAGQASLYINDRLIAHMGVAHVWTTVVYDVAQDAVHAGVNRIEIRWPARSVDWQRHIRAAVARLERGAHPEKMLILGEIQTFMAEVLEVGTAPSERASERVITN